MTQMFGPFDVIITEFDCTSRWRHVGNTDIKIYGSHSHDYEDDSLLHV
jgi:hypothetical protein